MQPFEFGVAVAQMSRRRFAKQADMFQNMKDMGGNLASGLNQSWNNGARAFKGMTGAAGAGLGAAAAGVGTGGMLIGNAAGSLVGKKPFSNEAVNTMAGAAGNYANVAKGYGQDLANSMGLGAQGLAGTTQSGSMGDDAWKNLEQQPGVSDFAQDMSTRGRNVLNTASNLAPAAAIGTGAKMLHAGAASAAPGSVAARGAAVAQPVMNTASKLTSGSNSLGVGGKVLYNAATPVAKAH